MHTLLIIIRKIYMAFFCSDRQTTSKCSMNYSVTSDIVSKYLNSGKPFMISRFGAVEIGAVVNYLGVKSKNHNMIKMIKGASPEWWWNMGIRRTMKDNAGFFPNTPENLSKFSELMLKDIPMIDVLISWQPKESYFKGILQNQHSIHYLTIDPFFADEPWSYYLKGKKVLVINPFSEEIENQYKNNRTKLFENSKILPEFNLIVYKSVQSIGGNSSYASWFDALNKMENDISKLDFDVALLGCGAYGMPLAAYIKRMGKQAIHIGGSLQLLFGIKGVRWEGPMYGYEIHHTINKYSELFNEFWIRPYSTSAVKNMKKVDNGCYW